MTPVGGVPTGVLTRVAVTPTLPAAFTVVVAPTVAETMGRTVDWA